MDSSIRNYPYWLRYPRIRWIDFSSVSIVSVLHSPVHIHSTRYSTTPVLSLFFCFLYGRTNWTLSAGVAIRAILPLCSHRLFSYSSTPYYLNFQPHPSALRYFFESNAIPMSFLDPIRSVPRFLSLEKLRIFPLVNR